MFKVGPSSVVKENDHLKVSIETESKTYNKIYIGSKADTVERKEEKAIVGTGTSKGYLFTFELPLSADGTDVAFVHIAKRTAGRVGKQTEITRFISHRQQKIKKTTQKILNREAIQERANRKPEVAKTRNREMRTRLY